MEAGRFQSCSTSGSEPPSPASPASCTPGLWISCLVRLRDGVQGSPCSHLSVCWGKRLNEVLIKQIYRGPICAKCSVLKLHLWKQKSKQWDGATVSLRRGSDPMFPPNRNAVLQHSLILEFHWPASFRWVPFLNTWSGNRNYLGSSSLSSEEAWWLRNGKQWAEAGRWGALRAAWHTATDSAGSPLSCWFRSGKLSATSSEVMK